MTVSLLDFRTAIVHKLKIFPYCVTILEGISTAAAENIAISLLQVSLGYSKDNTKMVSRAELPSEEHAIHRVSLLVTMHVSCVSKSANNIIKNRNSGGSALQSVNDCKIKWHILGITSTKSFLFWIEHIQRIIFSWCKNSARFFLPYLRGKFFGYTHLWSKMSYTVL